MDKDDAIALLLDLLSKALPYVKTCADDPAHPNNPAQQLAGKIDEAFQAIDCN